jgi:hypothetical protein
MSGRSSDYQVGYGKPPQHTRFRKGQSGNPKGRPKALPSLATVVNQVFNERVAIKENGERRVITKLQAALKQLANKAASGDQRAIRETIRIHTAAATGSRNELPQEREEQTRGLAAPVDNQKLALVLLNILRGSQPPANQASVAAAPSQTAAISTGKD